jgi:hypothetical protein
VRGTFGGWFEIEQPSRVAPAAVGVLIAAALVSWLATLLWLIAVVLGAFLVLASAGLVVIRRYNRRETGRFIERMGVLGEPAPVRAVIAAPVAAATVIHFHGGTHIHAAVPLGIAEDGRTIQAIPVRDVITITTEGNQES